MPDHFAPKRKYRDLPVPVLVFSQRFCGRMYAGEPFPSCLLVRVSPLRSAVTHLTDYGSRAFDRRHVRFLFPLLSEDSLPGLRTVIPEVCMENFVILFIPVLLGVLLFRLLLLPMRWGLRIAAHSAAGFACLWLLNSIAAFTGILFPINLATVLTAGFLGLPGMAVLALLAVI